jgi:HD-like signal output (HDOD) protein
MSEPEDGAGKLTILFVDDDINVLDGLQRVLRGQRANWDMRFVDSGVKALAEMEKRHYDVIVSDMRMPDLDGAALLSEVERRHPGTVRIILSGYSDEKSILRVVGPAHQYIAKPTDPQAIVSIMERTLALRRVLAQPQLRRLASSLRNLPTPPDLFVRLTLEMRKIEAAPATVAKLISQDVAMTAELLRVTNSSYFGLGSRVVDVLQAVRLLGLDTVRLLVLAAGLFKKFEGNTQAIELVRDMSRCSTATAGLARRLAMVDGASQLIQEQSLCGGMLSCIGALVFLEAEPRDYPAAIRAAGPAGLAAAERSLFGAEQAELGAYLLGLWGFGDPMIEAVLHQSRPSACGQWQKSALTYVHLARAWVPPARLMANAGAVALDEPYISRLGIVGQMKEWHELAQATIEEGTR